MVVDQQKRRRDISRIAIDLVAREGLEAATIRRLAAEARCSTAAITSYFADKQELLLSSFQVLAAEGDERFDEALRNAPEDRVGALLTMLPNCPANVRRWKAYLAFWDQAARDKQIARLIEDATRTGHVCIERALRDRIGSAAELGRACRLLNANIQGFALQILVDPESWTPERIREALEEALGTILATQPRAQDAEV